MRLPQLMPDQDHVQYVKEYLARGTVAQRGEFDGDYKKQFFGVMAQLLVCEYLGLPRPVNDPGWDGGCDLVWNEKKYDVKCKITSVPHQEKYPHNLSAMQINYPVDGYIFVSYNTTNGKYTLCGFIEKGQLLKSAKYFPEGSRRPRSNGSSMVVKGKKGMYELEDRHLTRLKKSAPAEKTKMTEPTETNTRDIHGVIKAWNKKLREREDSLSGETIYSCGFLLEETEEWHNIQSKDKAELEKLWVDAPEGSEVKCVEWRKVGSKYWNHKPGSWEVLKKGEGRKRFGGGGNYGFRPNKEEWLKEKASIILQSMVARAVELSVKEAKPEDVLKAAEKLLQWHNDKLLPQAGFLEEAFKAAGSSVEKKEEEVVDVEAIPEEDI